MDQLTSLSWNQVGNKINGTKYKVDSAILNFSYSIDKDWPLLASPNSEIRVLLNDNKYSESIKLSKANSTWQEVKSGGFDVTSLIQTDVNITLSIQVILLDTFALNDTYIISIDNASLLITYSSVSIENTDYELYLNDADETLSKAIAVKYAETVNITFVYKDSIDDFIPGATVELTIDSTDYPLDEPGGGRDHYNITINTTILHLGENFLTLTATKDDFETQEFVIKIEVLALDTELDLFIDTTNRTLERSEEIIYGKTINVTIKYRNTEEIPSEHITNATVELYGMGDIENLTESVPLEHYNITINSTVLGLGVTYLTINAQKENYSTQNIVFKIEVVERETYLDNIFINNTESFTYEVQWNELFNITVSYNDTLSNDFIANASVKVEGTGYSANFTHIITDEFYKVWINSSDLEVGMKYLTISARKDNYSIASQVITITVNEKESDMDIYLNQTLQTIIDIYWNEELNITAVYKDKNIGYFLNNATVSLKEGSIVLYNFSKTVGFDQYNLTINTNVLDLGVNALTIYAKKDNYTVSLGTITINVYERLTELDIYLNGTLDTSIEIAWNELLNISVIFKDLELAYFIAGATVSLKQGSIVLHNFDEQSSPDQYNFTINTAELGIGVSALTIYAKLDNYSVALGSIVINVVERDTDLIIYLNQTLSTSIEIPWGELLNITALYNDVLNPGFINLANLSLKDGSIILYNFSKHPLLPQYNLTFNASDFGLGVKALTVYAKKDNYSVSLVSLTINVVERATSLDVFLNKTLTTAIDITWGELLNITVIYNDEITPGLVYGANVTLRDGIIILKNITKHQTLDQYNLTLNITIFDIGVKALTIYAFKDNYSLALLSITINVLERETEAEIYLNDLDKTIEKSISLTNGQLLNITLVLKDTSSTNFIEGATVKVYKGLVWDKDLPEHSTFDHYNITLNSTTDLGIGVVFLTIIANKTHFKTYTTSLTIFIVDRATYYNLSIDGVNQTINPSIDRTVNVTVEFKLYFLDNLTHSHIKSANVTLLKGSTEYNLTENATGGYYNITINTLILDQGFNFLTFYAYRGGYIAQQILLTIEISEQETDLELRLNGSIKTTEPSIKVTIGYYINITVTYIDNVTKEHVGGATVELLGDFVDTLIENVTLKQYTLIINSTDLPSTVNFITVYAHRNNYGPKSLVLTIEIISRNTTAQLLLNGTDKTIERFFNITYGGLVNITMTYFDLDVIPSVHIGSATIKLIGLGPDRLLTEYPALEQYSIIINTTDLGIGTNFLTISCNKTNYITKSITNINIFVEQRQTRLDLFLNGLNKTLELDIDLPISLLFSIVIKYYDVETGDYINGATVQLEGGIVTTLVENVGSNLYSYSGNTTALDIGISIFSVVAQKTNYKTSTINFKINIERISTNVSTVTGETLFILSPGEGYILQILLSDLDFGGNITGANVTYSWAFGEGELQDLDGDGIYEADLGNVPSGTYKITITVYAGDNYKFERFEVTLNAFIPEEQSLFWLLLFLIALVSALVLSVYAAAYQSYLKYPKPVRKIHKFKKALKKKKLPDVEVDSLKESIKSGHEKETLSRAKFLKRVPQEEKFKGVIKASKAALIAPIPIVVSGGFGYKGNDVGVLLIHGGGKDSVADLKEISGYLASTGGFTVRVPFLAGFGGSSEEFLEIANDDIIKELETEIDSIIKSSKYVIIGGHSLGGILALRLAAKVKPDFVFSISAPSAIKEFDIKNFPVLKEFKDETAFTEEELNKIIKNDIHDSDKLSLKIAAKTVELINNSKKFFNKIESKTLLVQGKKDSVIKESSIDEISGLIKIEDKNTILLENSGHSLVDNPEKEELFSKIFNLIEEDLDKRNIRKKPSEIPKEVEEKPKVDTKKETKPKKEKTPKVKEEKPKKEPKPKKEKSPEVKEEKPKKEPKSKEEKIDKIVKASGPKPAVKELEKKETKKPIEKATKAEPKKESKPEPKKETEAKDKKPEEKPEEKTEDSKKS